MKANESGHLFQTFSRQSDSEGLATRDKNKGASKGSSSDAIEEPFLVPQRIIQSKVFLKNHLFLTFL